MNKKLNLVEILKDCPKGTKLYSTVWGDVYLRNVGGDSIYQIGVTGADKISYHSFTSNGKMWHDCDGECILFPSKDQRDWEKFVPPCKFKDGDIVATKDGSQVFILKRVENDEEGYCYIGYDFRDNAFFRAGLWYFNSLATEEEKQKFFDAIKLNGYKWNSKTKTLEKLVEPKFDPNTLKPFDKVLVRDSGAYSWICTFYSHTKECSSLFRYVTNNSAYEFCIPYNEETKHLVGTNEEAPEYYRYWES